MAWPTIPVNTLNADATGDDPSQFRADVLDLITKFNALIAAEVPIANLPTASNGAKVDNFPSLTTYLTFQQTTAPTGWTKQTTHNNKAFRVVSGAASSGGSSPFSTVFGKSATDAHTLSLAETPSHSHTTTANSYWGVGPLGGSMANWSAENTNAGSFGRATDSKGGGGSHTHNMDIRVQYVDLIIAKKD